MLEKVIGILECHPEISEAIVFGSAARGDNHNGSDTDLMVFVPPEVVFQWRYNLTGNLIETLEWEFRDEEIKLGSGPGQLHLIATSFQETERHGADKDFWAELRSQGKRIKFRP